MRRPKRTRRPRPRQTPGRLPARPAAARPIAMQMPAAAAGAYGRWTQCGAPALGTLECSVVFSDMHTHGAIDAGLFGHFLSLLNQAAAGTSHKKPKVHH